jgi:rubrerythrin
MRLEAAIRKRFIRRLIDTPAGRAYMLNLIVAGEESDQIGIFDRLAELADDEAGRKAALRHKQDEERHSTLYRECLARTGGRPEPVPKRLMLLRRMERKTDDAFAVSLYRGSTDGVQSRQDLMNLYAMMLASEERALHEFPALSRLFRAVGDDETANVFDTVTEDERRHVKYCQAMGRRYAPDEATWTNAAARFERIEAAAYREIGLAIIAEALTRDLLRFGAFGRLFGRVLSRVAARHGSEQHPQEAAAVRRSSARVESSVPMRPTSGGGPA